MDIRKYKSEHVIKVKGKHFARRNIRGVADHVAVDISNIVMIRFFENYLESIRRWEYHIWGIPGVAEGIETFKPRLGRRMDNYNYRTPAWSLSGLNRNKTNFYVVDPAKRFKDHRESEIEDALVHIQEFLNYIFAGRDGSSDSDVMRKIIDWFEKDMS